MAGLSTIFRSIRLRLLFLFLITMIALVFQVSFVNSTLDTTNEYKQKGQEYLSIDQQIFNDLTTVREVLLGINQGQIDPYIFEIIFEENLPITRNRDEAEQFRLALNRLNVDIQARQSHGYNLRVGSQIEFTSSLLGSGNLDIGGYDNPNLKIVDNSQTSAFITLNAILDLVQTGPNQYTIEQYVQSLNTGRKSMNDGFGELNELADYIDLNDFTGMGEILGAIYDTAGEIYRNDTDPIMLELFSYIDAQYANMTEYINQMIDYGNQIAVTDLSSADFAKLTEIYTPIKSKLLSNFQAAISLKQNDIDPIVTSLGNVTLRTFVNQLFLRFRNLHDALYNNLQIVGVLLPVQSSLVTRNTALINDKVLTENNEFLLTFNQVLDELNSNQDNVQQTAFIIIVIVTFISGWTAYQLIASFNRIQKGYSRITKGDLQIEAKSSYNKNELGNMDRGFDTMVTEIRRILSAIQRSSDRMAGISEELAAGSEEASASVQDVANTVREFSSGASEQNLLLNRIEDKLREHLIAIEETSHRINQTSTFVLKVAKRTNILGLNASIEAAKAGRFGLGFNVVAEEVRNLSEETKKSAIEIADLIESIETKIRNTVREIQHEVSITKDVAENTAAGSEEASASTSEQVIMLNEVSQTSNELSLLASELAEIASQFKV